MAPITGSHTRLLSALGLIVGIALLSVFIPRLSTNLGTVAAPAFTPVPPTALAVASPTTAEAIAPTPTDLAPTNTAVATLRLTPQPTTPISTAKPPSIQPATNSQSAAGDIRLAVLSTHYEFAALPSEGCGKVNSQRLGRRFDIHIAITNSTSQDLAGTAWGAAAYSNKQQAKLCYFEGQGTLPPLIAKHTITLTLSAFVEGEQEIDTLVVGTATGKVARLCFSQGLAKLCSS